MQATELARTQTFLLQIALESCVEIYFRNIILVNCCMQHRKKDSIGNCFGCKLMIVRNGTNQTLNLIKTINRLNIA